MLLLASLVLISAGQPAFAYASRSLTLRTYSDGYVNVAQTISVDPKATSVQVPLLSQMVSGLVATDQNGSPLSYGPSPSGVNLTVYTLGATEVTLRYDTDTLTAKNGTVWTLVFTTRYNSIVVLPQSATLVSVSGTPFSINGTNGSEELSLAPGTWKISYGIPFGAGPTTTTTTTTGGGASTTGGGINPSGAGGYSQLLLEVLGGVAAAVAAGLGLWWWRRRRLGPISGDLRPDDLQVLNFINEKGGKVLEPEIRMKFALPKTSAWRQIKRLERLGYVKVTKIGSQNQIEILRQRDSG